MRIMVDIDGCLGDFNKMMADYYHLQDMPEPDGYAYFHATTWKDFFINKDDFVKKYIQIVADHGYLNEAVIDPQAITKLNKLHDEGNQIVVATHRGFSQLNGTDREWINRQAHDETIEWLNKIGLNYDEVMLTADKGQAKAEVYIEDSPINIANLQKEGVKHIIMISHAYNRQVQGVDLATNDWNKIYQYIKSLEKWSTKNAAQCRYDFANSHKVNAYLNLSYRSYSWTILIILIMYNKYKMNNDANFDKYYIGLDCGTNSVGWAVTDEQYHLLRRRGKTLWGMRLFDEASTAAERRGYRSTRRRLARSKKRIKLLQSLFSREMAKVDPDFYIRLRESLFLEEDKRGFSNESARTKYILFNDPGYNDADYRKEYPTIWHLRKAIIEAVNNPDIHFDIRHYYLAIEHIIKHRGHFLRSGEIQSGAGDFTELWNNLCDSAQTCGINIDMGKMVEVENLLKQKISKIDKRKQLTAIIFDEDNPVDDEVFGGDYKLLANLLCGGKVGLDRMFGIEADDKLSLDFSGDNFEDKASEIDAYISDVDRGMDLILAAKSIYDYIYLDDLLAGNDSISAAMVHNYDQHKQDLAKIKAALKPFADDYKHFFNTTEATSDKDVFYNAYISKGSSAKGKAYNVNQEDLNKELERLFEKNGITGDLLQRAKGRKLLPKQRGYAKGTIPQQIHHNELALILRKLCQDYPSFAIENPNESPSYNTKAKKIEAIHSFRIPYYCGPMASATDNNNKFAWGEAINQVVYPWNYTELVDLGQRASRFIERMKNECTYVVGASTLPKCSLSYQKYMVLNELNNLKINGHRIDNDLKQQIYNQAYLGGELGGNVTLHKLEAYMRSVDMISKTDELGGSAEAKTLPKLSTHMDFYRILGPDYNKQYSVQQLDKIAELITILNNEPKMLATKVKEELNCTDEQANRLSKLKYSDWGQFSADFLYGVRTDVDGQSMTIMDALWETPHNLMELLGGEFGFKDELDKVNKAHADNENEELTYDQVQNLYCSPAVKRTVWQAIKIVNEIRQVTEHDPAKIFIEVTRGEEKGQKKVKLARRKDLLDKYHAMKKGEDKEINDLIDALESKDDRDLQSKKLFLYFQQMGKCAYTGERINIEEINNTQLYDIDHIYPRSKTKDDSITRNLVLVKAEKNREKTNTYPISSDIQDRMHKVWSYWYRSGLITKEKYERLTRTQPLTPDELAGFISRQLVETGQSTKAIGELLQEHLKDTKVITVKANLASGIRKYYGYNSNPIHPEFIKVRELNDTHHAKDAYLNIVAGNVINSTFTDNPYRWIKERDDEGRQNYTIRTELIFRDSEIYTKKDGNTTKYPIVKAWNFAESLKTVCNTMKRNDVVWTRMHHRLSSKGGGLMDAQLVRKADNYIPRKKDSRLQDTSKYGGYNSAMGAYFTLIELPNGTRKLVSIPILEESHVNQYIARTYAGAKVIIPRIDYMSKLVVNGFPVHLTGRTGDQLSFYPAKQLYLPIDSIPYLKRVCSTATKLNDKKYDITKKDEIAKDGNIDLFQTLTSRLKIFKDAPKFGSRIYELSSYTNEFSQLSLEDQCKSIQTILDIVGCNASHGDLSKFVPRAQQLGGCTAASNISNYSSIKLVLQSTAGLYEKVINLKTVQPGEVKI